MKKELPLSEFLTASPPSVVVLATCMDREGNANIITLGMYMPISFNPPLVCLGISPKRYSHDLIAGSEEFVVNVPPVDIVDETHLCGIKSGRDLNKFKETGLTLLPAHKVRPPLIKECYGHLECKLVQSHTAGDHTIFIGEVVRASINENSLTDGRQDPLKAKPLTQRDHVYFTVANLKTNNQNRFR